MFLTKAVWLACLREETHALGELCSGRSSTAVGHESDVKEQTNRVKEVVSKQEHT